MNLGEKELLKRPSSKDSEDDVLAFQEAFSQSLNGMPGSAPPAAKAIRMNPKPIKSVSFSLNHSEHISKSSPVAPSNLENKPNSSIPSTGGMVGDVFERNVDSDEDEDHVDLPLPPTKISLKQTIPKVTMPNQVKSNLRGFPEPMHRSRFAAKSSKLTQEKVASMNKYPLGTFPIRKGQESEFDKENIERISNMTEEELEAAFNEITSRFDSSSLDFFKRRAEQKYDITKTDGESDDDHHFVYEDHRGVSTDSTLPIIERVHPAPLSTKRSSPPPETTMPLPETDSKFNDKCFEEEKLEWTKDVHLDADEEVSGNSIPADAFRFDFSGKIIHNGSDIPSHSGLYHHGEEQQKPGYTIPELIHLSRSTVPAQRAFALSRLSLIVDNLNMCGIFAIKEANAIWSALFEKNLLLHVRIGIDESNETVIASALDCLAALLGCSTHYNAWSDLVDDACLNRNGVRIFATSAENIHDFRVKSSSFPLPELDTADLESSEDATIDQIHDTSKKDVIAGLLSMNILPRFRYLLQTKKIMIEQEYRAIQILTRIAYHSSSSAHSILSTEGLYDAIRSRMGQISWPPSNSIECLHVCSCLRLIRLAAQSSRMACQKLVEYGLFADLMRMLSTDVSSMSGSDHTIRDYCTQILHQTWLILTIVFSYQNGGANEFTSYYAIILKNFQCCLSYITSETNDTSLQMLRLGASCLRSVHSLIISSHTFLHIGSVNDLLAPFVGPLITIFCKILAMKSSNGHIVFALKSALIDFLVEYFRMGIKFQVLQHSEFEVCLQATNKHIMSHLKSLRQEATKSLLSSRLETFSTSIKLYMREAQGLGLLHETRIRHCMALQEMSSQFDVLSSIHSWSKTHLKPNDVEFLDVLNHSFESLPAFLETYTRLSPSHDDWIRWFGKGYIYWMDSLYSLYHTLASSSPDIHEKYREIVTCYSFGAVASCLPGDETLASKLINGYLFQGLLDNAADMDPTRIKNLFVKQLYSMDSLKASQSFYNRDASFGGPQTLFMELDPHSASLPFRRDWLFIPLERAFNLCKRKGSTSMSNDVIEGVVLTMKLIKKLETFPSAHHMSHPIHDVEPGMKLAHFMTVFLLTDESKNEVYFRDDIGELLEWGFLSWASNGLDLDKACGGQGRFFNFYQELLRHFVSTSYGLKIFAQYIILPLAMKYPVDYRTLFWSSIAEIIRSIDLDVRDLARLDAKMFLEPKENHQPLLKQYHAIMKDNAPFWDRSVDASDQPLLKTIIDCHLR